MKKFRKYSNPIILQSAAGYYIGIVENDVETGEPIGPYSRLSHYVKNREIAEQMLINKEYETDNF